MKEAQETAGENAGAKRTPWLRHAFAQLRIKLTLPYAFLAIAVAFIAAYLVTRLLAGVLDDRFQAALLDAGKKAADEVVYVEQDQLAVWRLVAYTEGFAESVAGGDGDTVGLLASPLAVNAHLDCLEVLDREGNTLLAMHHEPDGGATDYAFNPGAGYGEWEIVRKILAGEVDEVGGRTSDKYADLIETDRGWVFYTAGPVKREGEIVGVLLVGTYLNSLVQRLHEAALAPVSIYVGDGPPLATTLAPQERETLALDGQAYQAVLAGQEQWVSRRQVTVAGREYALVLGAFEARHGRDLGVLSVGLPLSFVTDTRHPTRVLLLALAGLATVTILVVGALLASTVVRRVQRLAVATEQVAQGNLTAQVESRGYDEVASLAGDFNRMVDQLREGRTYRDLLGLTASPEVAEQLRRGIEGGQVHLDPQLATASILFCDIRDFTRMSENRKPEYVIRFLNEYMRGIVTTIREHNGVINKFVGDAALAFFGILPEARPPEESARQAVSAALAILDYLEELNRQRRERNEEPLRVGIGVNTGPVVAGMLGSEMRLEYTVLGDAVNVAQRLSDLNKEFPQHDVFFSADTYGRLGEDLRSRATHVGETRVKGRVAPVDVYALARG
jgi:class 3 adenylate cyclase